MASKHIVSQAAPAQRALNSPLIRFGLLMLLQILIAARASGAGPGKFVYQLFPFVAVWDIFALALRVKSRFRLHPIIAYAPPTILTFGIAIQAAAAVYSKEPRGYLSETAIHLMWGAITFVAAFLFFDRAAALFQSARRLRTAAVIIGLAVYPATLLYSLVTGKADNDAQLSIFGVQLHELFKPIFVFFVAYTIDSTSRVSVKFLSIAIVTLTAVTFLVFMNEFGTIVIIVTSLLLSLIAAMDWETVSVSGQKGLASVGQFLGSIWRALKHRLGTNKVFRIAFIGVGAALLLLIVGAAVSHFDTIVDTAAALCAKIQHKMEDRVFPWLGITVEEHHEKLGMAIKNGGLWGIGDIRHAVYVPHFDSDCTFAMLVQQFGMLGGLLALGLYTSFAYAAQRECAKSNLHTQTYALTACILFNTHAFVAIATAVNLLPVIGLTTPLLSSGGMSCVITFALLGFITRECCQVCTDPHYESWNQTYRAMRNEPREKRKKKKGKKGFVMAMTALGLAGAVLLSTLAGLLYANRLIDETYGKVSQTAFSLGSIPDAPVAEVADIAIPHDANIYNLLIIGLDYEQKDSKPRSDSIMLLSLNRKTRRLQVYSILRDNYVTLPNGRKHKINAAYSVRNGGAEMLIGAIQNNFRIAIDDYLQTDIYGLQKIVDACGGIEMKITQAEADYLNQWAAKHGRESHFSEGLQTFSGVQATDYARARKAGNTDDDFGRTNRQRKVIQTLLDKNIRFATHLQTDAFRQSMDAAAESVTTSMDKETLKEILPDLLLAVKNWLADGGTTGGHIPYGKHYDNLTIDNTDYVQPQLRENAAYLHANIYGK